MSLYVSSNIFVSLSISETMTTLPSFGGSYCRLTMLRAVKLFSKEILHVGDEEGTGVGELVGVGVGSTVAFATVITELPVVPKKEESWSLRALREEEGSKNEIRTVTIVTTASIARVSAIIFCLTFLLSIFFGFGSTIGVVLVIIYPYLVVAIRGIL